ncbi:MAG TPA: metalloregulator ArsR/SmtB family transcription factor [Steroidobacteraceae bacterium]|nr:metalloregulator ArsR/SmtB family transcription factor [Steroidobacteraceae bacterium]
MTSSPFPDVVESLRAVAETTRLRILSVCDRGELTVGEIARVLGQSQPRVSRHLKLLVDVGLLQRFREQNWVYYRVPPYGRGADQAKQVLAWVDGEDPSLRLDHERAAEVRADRAREAAAHLQGKNPDGLTSAPEQEARLREVLLQEVGQDTLGDLLDIGTGTGRVLNWLGSKARQAIGIDLSSDALRVARTNVHAAGLSHCVLQQGDMYELAFPPGSFDAITIDRVLSRAKSPGAALKEAARLLRPQGRLIIVEDYDRLDAQSSASRHPLAILREWFAACGLACERLRPVDTVGEHLIVAIGRRPASVAAAA